MSGDASPSDGSPHPAAAPWWSLRALLTVETVDDRGRAIKLGALKELIPVASSDPRVKRVVDLAFAHSQAATSKTAGCLFAFLCMVGIFSLTPLVGTVLAWPFGIAWIVLLVAIFRVFSVRQSRRILPLHVSTFVEEGLCPCCGYNLHAIVPALDGCLVCPECAAAWQASRVLRSQEIVLGEENPEIGSRFRRSLSTSSSAFDRRSAQDDVGRTFVAVRVRALRRLRKSAAPVHQQRLSRAIRRLQYVGIGRRLAYSALMLFGLIAPATALITNPNSVVQRPYILLVGITPLCFAIQIMFSELGRPAKKTVDCLRDLNLCPGCGAMLDIQSSSSLRQDPNTPTKCPTCLCSFRTRLNITDPTH